MKYLILNGPNINRLGLRNPAKYGTTTLAEITADLDRHAATLGVELDHVQSNHEGDLIDWLHERQDAADGIVVNPAGLTYYGWSLYDALMDTGLPIAVVHIATFWAYEKGKRPDIFADLATVHLSGAGWAGYRHALSALHERITAEGS
ncbi:MAG: hypothetical protein JWP32_1685 [Schumannella sp.]|jgi:3-dehydroquinate dehydratase-2|nr:hypothetical protein [Schumannella sp.]